PSPYVGAVSKNVTPRSTARATAANRSRSSVAAPQDVPPTAQPPKPRRGSEVHKRGGGPTSSRAPGRIRAAPSGVAGGYQLRRLDDLGTMTAGHEFLRFDDLHRFLLRISLQDDKSMSPTGCRHTRQPVTLKPS